MNSQDFKDWLRSNNVIRLGRNLYATQDSLYKNRLTKLQAYQYFIKEYNQ
jgi:hypothetical protein